MIFQNYEYAQEIFERGDEQSRAIAACVHRRLISLNVPHEASPGPVAAFDVAYFYDSLSRTFSSVLQYPVVSGLSPQRAIRPVNVPNLENPKWRKYPFAARSMASRFLDCVCADATDEGSDFDVTFALSIACEAMDDAALGAILDKRAGDRPLDDFNAWLAGFSQFADRSNGKVVQEFSGGSHEGRALASRDARGGAKE